MMNTLMKTLVTHTFAIKYTALLKNAQNYELPPKDGV